MPPPVTAARNNFGILLGPFGAGNNLPVHPDGSSISDRLTGNLRVTSSVGVIKHQLLGRLWADLIGLTSLAIASAYMVYLAAPHANFWLLTLWAASFALLGFAWAGPENCFTSVA